MANIEPVENVDDGKLDIRISSGKFEGVIIRLVELKFSDDSDDSEDSDLLVEYDVLKYPPELDTSENTKKEFEEEIMGIVINLINQAIEDEERKNHNQELN